MLGSYITGIRPNEQPERRNFTPPTGDSCVPSWVDSRPSSSTILRRFFSCTSISSSFTRPESLTASCSLQDQARNRQFCVWMCNPPSRSHKIVTGWSIRRNSCPQLHLPPRPSLPPCLHLRVPTRPSPPPRRSPLTPSSGAPPLLRTSPSKFSSAESVTPTFTRSAT